MLIPCDRPGFPRGRHIFNVGHGIMPEAPVAKAAYNSREMKAKRRQRFAVGACVRVKNPGVNGVVTQLDSSPTVMGEYWHTIRTEHGERREPGCNIELVPAPLTNAGPRKAPNPMVDELLLLPEQAIPMLHAQLEEAVETLRYDDPDVDEWERITLRIVERTFGEHKRNANHFVGSVTYPHHSDEEAQVAHAQHIASKKGLLRAFIKELEIIPPHRPQVDVTKQAFSSWAKPSMLSRRPRGFWLRQRLASCSLTATLGPTH